MGVSKDRALENAIEISTVPHRLFRNDASNYTYWAESFVPERIINHYLPLDNIYTFSVATHESTHLSENGMTRFQLMTFFRDFIGELPEFAVDNSEILETYLRYGKLFNVKLLDNFLGTEWKDFTEASAYVEQISSFVTPNTLTDSIINDLKSKRKRILILGAQIIRITEKILLRMDKQSGWTESEYIYWQTKLTKAKYEWEIRQILNLELNGIDSNGDRNLILKRTIDDVIKSSIIDAIYKITSRAWDQGRHFPPLINALTYLDRLAPDEIPNWSSPFQISNILNEKLQEHLKLEPYHSYPDSYFLFYFLSKWFQSNKYDEVLKKYIYGLVTFITMPFILGGIEKFPKIVYYYPSRKDLNKIRIVNCNQFLTLPNPPLKLPEIYNYRGKAFPEIIAACRKLLVIRNQLSTKCNKSCRGKAFCPIRDEYFLRIKKAWKPLYFDVQKRINKWKKKSRYQL